jgi:hypothetical protein
MSKQPMQDIIPSEKRSIRRVDISRSKRHKARIQQEDNRILPPLHRRRGYSWRMWTIASIVLVILIGIIYSLLSSGADIRVTPRQEVVTVDGIFSARQGAEFGELPFEILTIVAEAHREVPAHGEEQVERKATGSITIYNTYDENPQRFIKNTRFESPDGLIYRIPESTVVPGQTKNADGTFAPGTVQIAVEAETSGTEYNKAPTHFTIPGLKSDPARFKGFYAESKKQIKGGFSGVTKVVSEDDQTVAENELENELRATLTQRSHGETPEGFLLFDEATLTRFDVLPVATGQSADTADVSMKGILYGIVFNEDAFGEYLALQTVSDYDRAQVHVIDPEVLQVTLKDKATLMPSELERANIQIVGTPRLVWQFDEALLIRDLVSKPKSFAETIFREHPAINSAHIVVSPFWRRALPSRPEDIHIKIEIEE